MNKAIRTLLEGLCDHAEAQGNDYLQLVAMTALGDGPRDIGLCEELGTINREQAERLWDMTKGQAMDIVLPMVGVIL